jgi:hemerythrin-like domain-containing protein
VDDGLAEHHHVEASLRELIASDPEAPGVDGLVAAMIGEVRHHVEEEEQEILPTFAEQVSNQELSELGERFTAAKEKAREQLRTRP